MILEEYQPENQKEMQNALKDIFGPMFKSMLQVEMDDHLDHEPNSFEISHDNISSITDRVLEQL